MQDLLGSVKFVGILDDTTSRLCSDHPHVGYRQSPRVLNATKHPKAVHAHKGD